MTKLAALRDNGTLTQAEFDRQKDALLTPTAPPTSSRTTGQMIVWGIIGVLVILGIWLYSRI